MAISVAVVIGDAVADKLIKKLTAKISNLKVLNGMDANSEMGPLISKQQQERVKKIITSAAKEGAELVVDGRDLVVTGCEAGFFVGATLVDNVKPSMQVYQEEIFGPVLCVVRVKSLIEAIELINNNQYANGTAIYTNNGAASREFVAKIEVGMVGVNVPIPVPMAFHSFGGWKSSLFGDMHVHGKEGVNFYTRLKTITERWPTTSLDAQFVMPVMS